MVVIGGRNRLAGSRSGLFLCAGTASAPKLGCVEPARAAALFRDCVHHMARAARPVAAFAVPQTDEIDFVRSEAKRGIEHPAVIAFVGILTVPERAELARGDMK